MALTHHSVPTADHAASDVPSREELVARAAALVPLLAEDAAQSDRDRNVTPRVVDAITQAGLMRLMVPRRLGGYETDARTLLEVLGKLGEGCGSAAWITGVISFSLWEIGLFGDEAQHDVWDGSPDARAYFSISPTAKVTEADGGIVLNGRWPNGSGSAHSQWGALGFARSFGPTGPQFAKALVPVAEGTIEDTWHTAGMRGTASNTLVLDDVFVPEYRILPDLRAAVRTGERLTSYPEERLYAANFAAIGTIGIIAPQLGMLEAAYRHLLALVDGKPVPAAGVKDQTATPNFQMRLAEARTRIDVAWMLVRRAAETTDAGMRAGEPLSDLDRGQLRMDMTWASRELVATLEIMLAEGGFSSLHDGSPLQRIWRDVSLATRHSAFRQSTAAEAYGRLLVGLDAGPIFPF